jgi:hypothetical protein
MQNMPNVLCNQLQPYKFSYIHVEWKMKEQNAGW